MAASMVSNSPPTSVQASPVAKRRLLPLLREDGGAIPIFVCTRTVYFFEIVRHPFFVFGQREVALFELPKFVGFGRQTSRLQPLCVFGPFRTILLCCEHEASHFFPRRIPTGLSFTPAASICKPTTNAYH